MKSLFKHFWAICFLFAVEQGVFADNIANIPAPDVHVGDSWTFRIIDGFTKDITGIASHRVVEVTPDEINVLVEWKDRPIRSLWVFDHQWRLKDDSVRRFEPYRPDYQFPMGVGVQWEKEFHSMIFKTGAAFSEFVRAKVVGKESVTVPAGSFEAYRIEIINEARSTAADGSISKTELTIWYSPDVKRFVKQEIRVIANGRVRNKTMVELTESSTIPSQEPSESRAEKARDKGM